MNQRIVLRRVRNGQISMFFRQYQAPQLKQLEGQLVEIRYNPEDRSQISVFRAGRHVCVARMVHHLVV